MRGSTGTSRCPSTAGAARMKDVSVLLGSTRSARTCPLGRAATRRGGARAEDAWQWRGNALLLEPFSAGNDRFDVHARLGSGEAADGTARPVGCDERGRRARGRPQGYTSSRRKWFDGQPGLAPLGSPGVSRAASDGFAVAAGGAAHAPPRCPISCALLRRRCAAPAREEHASSSSSASPVYTASRCMLARGRAGREAEVQSAGVAHHGDVERLPCASAEIGSKPPSRHRGSTACRADGDIGDDEL